MSSKHETEMKEALKSYAALARRTAKDKFILSKTGFYLLIEVHEEWEDEMSFNTNVRNVAEMDSLLASKEESMGPGLFLAKVQKTARADWISWVTVGRARNNDIVLRHSSVSKLQAQIHTAQEPKQDPNSPTHFVIDANSANGTKVNDRLQHQGEPAPIFPGDRVEFGELTCTFLDAELLFDRLRSLPKEATE